ncbi:helix-turn-helix domain-containing protein [Novosphingobium capsulatum]|uniref:helix-turn-helix domain-containing protein n=1 Tax=Novosphingobium capsulatum TaxID=13688 RepID=UPI000786A72C|nr:helix-turn-helix transcriptional regulator [Novosphingobium capsulatum]WQD92375.1 short-chain fatty acyl-CoA regulator family protein [Novosphingobium capsulatum]
MARPAAPSRPLYLGPRIKRLRRELGLTQQAMAEDMGVSPSYIALIERNQRPLTADLLLRLAATYRLDMPDLAAQDRDDHARRLAEALRDPLFAEIDLPALEVADLATSFPGMTEAMLRLHGAYARAGQALAEGREAAGAAPAADPVGEARRFLAARGHWFAGIETRAEALSAEIETAGGGAEWLRRNGLRVRAMPASVMMGALARYDRHNEQLLLDECLGPQRRAWQIALHIAYTSLRPDIAAIVRGESFASATAAQLVRRALAELGAAAVLMPYDRFARAAQAQGYDVQGLADLFGVEWQQAALRLATLTKPGQEGVPFFLVELDSAGNVVRRIDGAGFSFAAQGGGCPLWSLHQAFARPGEVLTQWLEMPHGDRFFSMARTIDTPAGPGLPPVRRAMALVCPAQAAPRLAAARGVDPQTAVTTPVGVTCRLCQRAECPARAQPPLGREILPDDYRRAAVPFVFSES